MEKKEKTQIKRGRPVDHSKKDTILKIATELFMKQGFASTTMDHVAREAGMSKLTLYRHFPDKNAIFLDVICNKSKQYAPDELFDVFYTKTPFEALYTIGLAMFSLLMSDDSIHLNRMMAGDATNNSELPRLFYDRGPLRMKRLMMEKMKLLGEAGKLKIKDPVQATDQFFSLFKGSTLYMRRLLNIDKKPSQKVLEAHVKQAVEFFIAAYTK